MFVFDCTCDAGVACVDQIKPFKVSFLHSLVCKQYQEYEKIVTINDDGMHSTWYGLTYKRYKVLGVNLSLPLN